jgi:hypothetical protein
LNRSAAEWKQGTTQSLEGIFLAADALAKAEDELIIGSEAFKEWLKKVCKISYGSASKWLSISRSPFLRKKQYRKRLPLSFTAIYELSKIDDEEQFKTVMMDIEPDSTSADVHKLVNKALGKDEAEEVEALWEAIALGLNGCPYKKLAPTDQRKVQDFAAKQTPAQIAIWLGETAPAPKPEEPGQTTQAAPETAIQRTEEAEAWTPADGNESAATSGTASGELTDDEPSDEEIDETLQQDFADDNNDVMIMDAVRDAYKAIQVKRVRRFMMEILHDQGIRNVSVVISPAKSATA